MITADSHTTIWAVPEHEFQDYVWDCDCDVKTFIDNNWGMLCIECGAPVKEAK